MRNNGTANLSPRQKISLRVRPQLSTMSQRKYISGAAKRKIKAEIVENIKKLTKLTAYYKRQPEVSETTEVNVNVNAITEEGLPGLEPNFFHMQRIKNICPGLPSPKKGLIIIDQSDPDPVNLSVINAIVNDLHDGEPDLGLPLPKSDSELLLNDEGSMALFPEQDVGKWPDITTETFIEQCMAKGPL